MENDLPEINIDSSFEFQQALRKLLKKCRHIRSDIEVVTQELQNGNLIGDRIQGVDEELIVFKARVRNSDAQKGKSGGYRLIYQVISPLNILFLTIYSKSEREDISTAEIRDILDRESR